MPLKLPDWLRWYKKPEYRDIREYAANLSAGKRPLSPDGRNGGIPNRLRLERILANKTCKRRDRPRQVSPFDVVPD